MVAKVENSALTLNIILRKNWYFSLQYITPVMIAKMTSSFSLKCKNGMNKVDLPYVVEMLQHSTILKINLW